MDHSEKKGGADRIVWLDVARCIAILSITLNHALSLSYAVYHNASLEFSTIPMISTLFKTVVYVFSRLGVPLFLMITGSLILKKPIENAADVKRFYKKNFLPLFITSEIWMALYFAFRVLTNSYARRQSIILTAKSFLCTMVQIEPLTLGNMWYIPMILCVYLFLPFMAMVKGKAGLRNLLLPGGAILFYCFLLPSVNLFFRAIGHSTFTMSKEIILLSEYLLYVVVGYLISTGILAKIKTVWVALSAAIMFLFNVLVQLFFFRCSADVTLYYSFIGILLFSVPVFELIRRTCGRLKKGAGLFASLSRMAFGVFFLHIPIMLILRMAQFSAVRAALPQPLYLIYLEVVAFSVSVAVVWLLNKIPRVGKLLFLYK